jgi:hypothetical protein
MSVHPRTLKFALRLEDYYLGTRAKIFGPFLEKLFQDVFAGEGVESGRPDVCLWG